MNTTGGAGSFPAGVGPAGAYVPTTTTKATIGKPTVTYFDPGTMTAPFAADGALVSAHPVDAQVILALSIEQGQIPSVPQQGHRYRQLGRMTPDQLPAAVLDATNLALAGPLSRGDIELLSVDAMPQAYGSLYIAVSYTNLRLPNSQPRTVSIDPS